MLLVEYHSNNSGGGWWLDDKDWKSLEAHGWNVAWFKDNPSPYRKLERGRYMGALATNATRSALSLDIAIAEWEFATGMRASDPGCSCCGPPHNFEALDESSGEYEHFYDYEYDDE